MQYPRKLLSVLREHIDTREIIVLTGMRRVGKTTLYRMLFEEITSINKVFLDIENPIEQKIFEETDYNNIWANLAQYKVTPKEKAYIFLDEIQAMPSIVSCVKYLYDHYDVKFFLTGSSSFYLKNLFPESLSGRKFIFELYPLDFEEFLFFKQVPKKFYISFAEKDQKKNLIGFERVKKLYDEHVAFGGFPQVVNEEKTSQKILHINDIFKSYFEKEVKLLSDFRDIKAFRDLLLLLMERISSKLDISKLSSEVGISRETVYSYLSFLEGTYFITLVSPFSRSVDREVSGAKKVYLCDTGILNQFAKVSEGGLFENSVFNNLRKYGKIYYYQRRSGGELDFIINEKVAIEGKMRGSAQDIKKARRIAKELGLSESYIVTREFMKDNGFVPATEL